MTEPNFQNRTLYHGDNLPFLRGMNSETIHLIATDPPFNKGRDFHATPDSLAKGAKFEDRWSWARDVEQEWVDQIRDDWPAVHIVIEAAKSTYGEDMAAFLCWLGVRLLEMHRILRTDGSIYLHIDHTAHAYVKTLMDAIFGKANFRNEIVWAYSGWNKRLRAHLERRHDTLLFYAKSKSSPFYYPTRPWAGKEEYIRVRKQKVRTDDGGREYVLSDAGGGARVRRYLDEAMKYGVPIDDIWHIDKLNNSDKRESKGYPTQKPLALYERIIKASSKKGQFVLDPFCGCATTPIAAERLGRKWVGMDRWDGAAGMVRQRIEDNRQLLRDPNPQVHYLTTPPTRTDKGETAAPFLQPTERYAEPAGPRMSRADMYAHLLAQYGQKCQGCDRAFDDPRYLELDHNTPRSDGGINHITNRVLLCGPCNKSKSNTYTLSGLRKLNRKNGWMVK